MKRGGFGARWTAVASLAFALTLSACDRPPANAHNPSPTATPAPAAAAPAVQQEAAAETPTQPVLAPVADYVLPGPLAPDTGPEQLRQLFGADNVEIGEHLPGGEGTELRGVILFPRDSTRRAYLYFQDSQHLRGLSAAAIVDRDTRWHLDTGLRMGLSLAELARLNGKPIQFSGLGWDYGGTIADWNGGKLAGAGGDAVIRRARLDYVGQAELAPDALPSGDGFVSSDDKRYPQQDRLLTVIEFSVSFPGEDDL
ncbi:hypothetical protein [Pseudomonas sp. CGJS7]|uniref:hypothetical protein n=1 Tax=Pseudomonas sp. CGJS7 TaxID=3109348 RepID=UPI00300AD779